MKPIYISTVTIFILMLFSYNSGEQKSELTNKKDTVVPEKTEPLPYEGNWIMSNFIDSVYSEKRIAGLRRKNLVSHLLFMEIKNDSIYHNGLIINNTIKLIPINDTSFKFQNGNNTFYYYEDNIITGNLPEDSSDEVYLYRRMSQDEENHFINNKNLEQSKFWPVYNRFFKDKLIVGKYLYNGIEISLMPNDSVTGYKNYSFYDIHAYTGTFHPYQENDVIFFFDKKGDHPAYSWKWKGNNLELTEMICPEDKMECYPGTKKMTWKKIE